MAALRALYSTRDLDNVPTLIYAPGRPGPAHRVKSPAMRLRLLSRKVDGFGLPEDPTEGAKLEVIEKWKQWYLAIRPERAVPRLVQISSSSWLVLLTCSQPRRDPNAVRRLTSL